MIESNTRISKLEVKNFTAFSKLNISFCSGINVIIGENSTGKTHLMKLLYGLLKSNEEMNREKAYSLDKKQSHFAKTLVEIFKPDNLGRLTRRHVGVKKTSIKLTLLGKKNPY